MNKWYAMLPLLLALLVVPAMAGQSPQTMLQQTTDQLRQRLAEQPDAADAAIREILLPRLDMPRIARLALGKHWRRASADQQQRFIDVFRERLIASYAAALQELRDADIEYQTLPGKGLRVRSKVQRPGAPLLTIDYRLHQHGQDWKVYDVIIEGVSLVTSYRSSFARELRAGGMAQLIKALQQRQAQSART